MKKRTERLFFGIGGMVLIALCLSSLRFGVGKLDTSAFFGGLFFRDGCEMATVVLYHVRLPRLLGALVAGVGLSVSGFLLQTVTGNPMAGPSLVGVNAGAGFAVIFTLSFLPYTVYTIPISAFLGAFLTTVLIVALSSRMGMGKGTLVLTGLAIGAVLSAGISLLSLLDTDVLASYQAFSVGSLAAVRAEALWVPAGLVLLAFLFALSLASPLDVLRLGEPMAALLGIRVQALSLLVMVLSSVLAASAVSFVGLLGFVGLMAPHIAAFFVGSKTRVRLLATALMGSILVVAADFLGRIVLAPGEMPVGVLMSLLGAPFFLFLLFRKGEEYA